jgi:hypothetical protein
MRNVTDEDPNSRDELRRLAVGRFGDLVEAPSVDDPVIRERTARLVLGLVRR